MAPRPDPERIHHAITVRRATPGDAEAIAGIHARSWQTTYAGLVPAAVIDDVVQDRPGRSERWRTRLSDPAQRSRAYVAELDDRICGFVVWGASRDPDATRDTAEVYAIYLDPDAIGRGVGRSLFATAIDDIVAQGSSAAILWVLDTNERARRFYAAADWHPDGATKTEERPGGTLHEVRYARNLI